MWLLAFPSQRRVIYLLWSKFLGEDYVAFISFWSINDELEKTDPFHSTDLISSAPNNSTI